MPVPPSFGSASRHHITSTEITVTLPTGTAEGDLLIGFVANSVDTTITTPSGWNKIGSTMSGADGTSALFWKIAGVSESNPTFVCGASGGVRGMLVRYINVVDITPDGALNAPFDGTGTTTPTPGVTHSGLALEVRLGMMLGTSLTFTPPSGMTERYDNAQGAVASWTVADQHNVTGASGSKTFSHDDAGVTKRVGATISLPYAGLIETDVTLIEAPQVTTRTDDGPLSLTFNGGILASDVVVLIGTRRGNLTSAGSWTDVTAGLTEVATRRTLNAGNGYLRTHVWVARRDAISGSTVGATHDGVYGDGSKLVLVTLRGVETPHDVVAISSTVTFDTTRNCPTITPTVDAFVLLGAEWEPVNATEPVPPGGVFQEFYNSTTSVGSNVIGSTEVVAGATGARTFTHVGNANHNGWQLAFPLASGGIFKGWGIPIGI